MRTALWLRLPALNGSLHPPQIRDSLDPDRGRVGVASGSCPDMARPGMEPELRRPRGYFVFDKVRAWEAISVALGIKLPLVLKISVAPPCSVSWDFN